MGIILLLLAIILKTILSPILIVYGFIRCIILGIKSGYKTYGFWGIFIGPYIEIEDWLMGMHLWNDMFRKKGGYNSGDRLDTISYFLGSNSKKNKLTKAGNVIVKILDTLDEDHSNKAYDIGNQRLKNKLEDL